MSDRVKSANSSFRTNLSIFKYIKFNSGKQSPKLAKFNPVYLNFNVLVEGFAV